MPPAKPLPYPDDFSSADQYVDSLLHFATTSTLFQTLCGGVHILDFFIESPTLYHNILPEEWRGWLLDCPEMDLLDLLLRDDLSLPRDNPPPESFIKYIREIRKHSLLRGVERKNFSTKKLPKHVAVGMIPKKVHEVTNFADYVVRVADSVKEESGKEITHFVDFGSGQNYLGRALASPPWNRWIVAVESKGGNIEGAKNMDILAGMAEREKVMRNKKVFREKIMGEVGKTKRNVGKMDRDEEADLRPARNLQTIYTPSDGKGYIQYVEHRVEDGDLSDVVSQIEKLKTSAPEENLNIISEPGSTTSTAEEIISRVSGAITPETNLMAISIHSCGNLSHHGIRSLLLNPSVHAIAIVGCCYNLLSERLTLPSFKHPLLRPNLRAVNLPTPSPSSSPASADPHGFPMSNRLATYNETGITLNITSRMMGVQAPANWTAKDSESFFTRHFYRALLQKLFLDYGVVQAIPLDTSDHPKQPSSCTSPECGGCEKEEKSITTTPIIIGSLRKTCYTSFTTYVRGAIQKLTNTPSPSSSSTSPDTSTPTPTPTPQAPLTPRTDISTLIHTKLDRLTDHDIETYEARYSACRKELSIMWSLMAFSAGVVESMIVTDRYLFLCEAVKRGECRDAWVEGVFEYKVSPRNLVVVGVK
ncbi:hypothetical protein SS1G_01825 [Sclerotinia sclerotiorum 1980 UF-70]|uniref:Methyltransferase domain-containing protein n=2 Tax=Sclerotinia sclerotiorum (strain ATCC 18683 / 1980 / Ss-1) TaxID=665079 RepID=A7E945_SCLS1|nr:hypothetical protein SS1G_01825 [Sclerotinia sclerotiorum 1980 UF-70]APA05805.1 hypothetical protein sscle_01g005750 [Sclerotinia sclerotiorum 1980 UF-70]EDN96897.1 hypothetical protein SS1G_01825 [Sclerotinia sclerotiorum 1980 UF-70]